MDLIEKYKLQNRELEAENKILVENNKKRDEYIEFLKDENKKLREELDAIKYSRSYKIMKKIKGIIKR